MERHHQDYMNRIKRIRLIDRKNNYLKDCEVFFERSNQTLFNVQDIPWPIVNSNHQSGVVLTADTVSELLFCDMDSSDADGKKTFLRDQQLQWHPDRFMQRCRQRMCEKSVDRIMEKVNLVSQILNAMS